MKILIVKSEDKIIIANNGKHLIINKNDENFNELYKMTNENIEKWYLQK